MWFTGKLKTDALTLRNGIFYGCTAEVSYADEVHDRLFELEDNSFWFKHRNRVIKAVIDSMPPKDNRIIELGGGNGNMAHYLIQHGYKTAMIEPGEHGCKNAARRGLKNIVCGFMNTNTVQENSVEAVGLFDVLEHIEDDAVFLKNLRELLIEDGFLYMTVPAHQYLWSESDKCGHFRRYELPELREKVKTAGYAVDFVSYFFWFMPFPIFLLRALPYRACAASRRKQAIINQGEFVLPNWLDRLARIVLGLEIDLIAKAKSICFGASIILVARKI
ncbi:MAG: class I SAM-dependent methyltransferase [Synergistaceae bacterium]|jgi:SAM-dependent methyltransferase|nr:class I SAM-dependent methyltransferase [Synergistaceae bacterium]